MKTKAHLSSPCVPLGATPRRRWTTLVLGLWLATLAAGQGQPVPHHFGRIAVAPDRTATLSLNGSIRT